MSLFFFILTLAEGRGLSEAKQEVRTKLWPTLKTSWHVWPFISFVNFMFIPNNMQVTFINVVSIFWGVYMSYIKNLRDDNKNKSIESIIEINSEGFALEEKLSTTQSVVVGSMVQ